MTLKQLYYFQKLAETESYTRTAQDLYVSQPSLSYTMKELEKEFSTPLFEKEGNRNRIRLSSSGKTFLGYVNEALRNIEEGKNAVNQLTSTSGNVLNVGYMHTFCLDEMEKLFHEFELLPTETSITFRQSISNRDSELQEQLRLRKLDFAFCLEPSNGITSFPCFYQELFFFVSKKHPLAQRHHLTFDDIKDVPCIRVNNATTINRIVDDIFRQHSCEPHIFSYAGNINVALTYVLGSDCYTVAPILSTMNLSQMVALPLEGVPMKRPIYFAWKTNREFTPKDRMFYAFINSRRQEATPVRPAL
jgi:DNA-binding transcriptional LysR family regulator